MVSEAEEVIDPLLGRLADAAHAGNSIARVAADTLRISAPPTRPGLSIEVRARGRFDLDVAFFVPDRRGSPFEQVFVAPQEEADRLMQEVVQFVRDLLEERRVLAWDSSFLRGGRHFLDLNSPQLATHRHLAWVVSWRGTHDWSSGEAAG